MIAYSVRYMYDKCIHIFSQIVEVMVHSRHTVSLICQIVPLKYLIVLNLYSLETYLPDFDRQKAV